MTHRRVVSASCASDRERVWGQSLNREDDQGTLLIILP